MKTFLFLLFVFLFPASGRAETAAEQASHKEALFLFPDLKRETTQLFAAVDARIRVERKAKSPLLENPQWPLIIAISEAVKLGVQPLTPSSTIASSGAATEPGEPEFTSFYNDPDLAAADILKQKVAREEQVSSERDRSPEAASPTPVPARDVPAD